MATDSSIATDHLSTKHVRAVMRNGIAADPLGTEHVRSLMRNGIAADPLSTEHVRAAIGFILLTARREQSTGILTLP